MRDLGKDLTLTEYGNRTLCIPCARKEGKEK